MGDAPGRLITVFTLRRPGADGTPSRGGARAETADETSTTCQRRGRALSTSGDSGSSAYGSLVPVNRSRAAGIRQ